MDKAAKRSQRSFAAIKTGAVAAGGGLVLAGLAAKKAFREFEEAEKATSQTRAVLKSTGNQAKMTAAEIENLANKLSLKSGIDDEAIQSGENLLLTFTKIRNETGKGNKIFNEATSIVLDMSVALGTTLKSAAIQVGKALQDPENGITALRRVGVNFTKEQKERIQGWVEEGKQLKAQKFILKELRTEFAGSAAAQATGAAKLQVAYDNLFEAFGKAFGPDHRTRHGESRDRAAEGRRHHQRPEADERGEVRPDHGHGGGAAREGAPAGSSRSARPSPGSWRRGS